MTKNGPSGLETRCGDDMKSEYAKELAGMAPVIPVITIDRLEDAVPMAEALVAGGLPVLEVTLRTPVALEAIRAMATVPGGVVGAGTILTTRDADLAAQAGAKFAVSPGSTPEVMAGCEAANLPLLPGVATATEVMAALSAGYDMLKFFPAEANGGAPVLKSYAAPLAAAQFCPTGGVSPSNAESYLALPNVRCVGGSWVLPKDAIAAGDWDKVTALAKEAAALPR